MQHIFIVGSKGIPGNYGGYETFVDKLTEYHQNEPNIRYHVACAVDDKKNVKGFSIKNCTNFRTKICVKFPAFSLDKRHRSMV